MDQIDKQKLIVGAIACAIVCVLVIFLDRSPTVSRLLDSAPSASARSHASSTPRSVSRGATQAQSVARALVNINTAGKEELMTLHGIGSSKADAILHYRNLHGTFYRTEDVMKVSGIGGALYGQMRDNLTVGTVTPPSAPIKQPVSAPGATSIATSSAPQSVAHIVISQIMAGTKENAEYKYIELYNAGAEPVDLSSWSIKKKTSTGSISTLVSSSHMRGKTIPAGKHFLLADSGYTGVTADVVWPSSYTFARSNNALILYSGTGQIAETVAWKEIPEGKSYTRTTPDSQNFIVAEPQPHNSSS